MKHELTIVAAAMILSVCKSYAKDKPKFTAEALKLPGKKGACFTLRKPGSKASGGWDTNVKKVKALDVYWNYSWGADLVPVQPKGIEFVPMIWGGKDPGRVKEAINTKVVPAIKSGRVKKLLGFNEPDGHKQADMTVEQALAGWPALESAGVPLASPGAVHADRDWMKKFMEGVKKKGYRVDYIAVHSYGGPSAKGFKARMKKIYELHEQRPLIITEFACADWNAKTLSENRHSPAEVLAFMKEVLPWMEEQDWIVGYAWFSFGMDSKAGHTSALFDDNGDLTACGRYYKSVTKANPEGDQGIKPDVPGKR